MGGGVLLGSAGVLGKMMHPGGEWCGIRSIADELWLVDEFSLCWGGVDGDLSGGEDGKTRKATPNCGVGLENI